MIGFLLTIRDAVLVVLMGWVSVGSGEYADSAVVDWPSLVPVAIERCSEDGDELPRSEGA